MVGGCLHTLQVNRKRGSLKLQPECPSPSNTQVSLPQPQPHHDPQITTRLIVISDQNCGTEIMTALRGQPGNFRHNASRCGTARLPRTASCFSKGHHQRSIEP